MEQEANIAAIAHLIQLAVAPVFLLSGIGAMLAVMTTRLARIIDRARVLQEQRVPTFGDELVVLSARARTIGISIALCTITALLICAVICMIFLSSFLSFNPSLIVAILFITAMVTFICGLLALLREIFLGTSNIRSWLQETGESKPSR
ncbi:MAG: DUF2721 domain-containing protein [Gammaproteobacteria bacterium]|nr:DUF2721 domain-containing protein [Gammaproteobacteria bacterium]